MVQTVKNLIRKCNLEQRSFYSGLRLLRNTPLADGLPSPAQLLQGRNLYEMLPVRKFQLFLRAYDGQTVNRSMTERAQRMKEMHDKGG